jgi:hypothetical protein
VRILLIWIAALLSCSSSQAANEAFPEDMRGLWGDSQATCDSLRMTSPANFHDGQRWLKITATDVLGTTQGRFLRQIPAQRADSSLMKSSFEIQKADALGLVVTLHIAEQGWLVVTMLGAHTAGHYRKC